MRLATALLLLLLSAAPVAAQVSVAEMGAIPDDGQDDSDAFRRALAAVPENGLVEVPMGSWDLDGTLVLENRHLVGRGMPLLRCRMSNRCIEVAGWQVSGKDEAGRLVPRFGSRLAHFRIIGNPKLERAVHVSVGDFGRLDTLFISAVGGDCLVVEPKREWAWVENLRVADVKCQDIGGNAFVVRVPAKGHHNYVNETVWSNIESRNVAGHAFLIENLSGSGGPESKISKLQIEYSELSAVKGVAADIVRIHAAGRGLVEFVLFHWVTIEDTAAEKAGFCLQLDSQEQGRIATVRIAGSICYGARSGGIGGPAKAAAAAADSAGF